MTDDLITWLRAQLDEDERIVRLNLGDKGLGDNGSFPDYQTYSGDDINAASDFLFNFRPPRMLAEVQAKRQILDEYESPDNHGGYADAMGFVVTLLALPFADRPGYQDEWRP